MDQISTALERIAQTYLPYLLLLFLCFVIEDDDDDIGEDALRMQTVTDNAQIGS